MASGGVTLDGQAAKRRLDELFTLAMAYRRWTQKELAEHLGRDPHNMTPGSGLPKIDLLVGLADALDWTTQEIVDALYGPQAPHTPTLSAGETWESLDAEAFQATSKGRFREAVQIARKENLAARASDEIALACLRETLAWEGLGQYARALEACQRGLCVTELKSEIDVALELNLANLHYILGNVREAKGIASSLLDGLRSGEHPTHTIRGAVGFARFVLGNCYRVTAGADSRNRERNAHRAIVEFLEAQPLLLAASSERGNHLLIGAADQCEGVQLEMQALLGVLPAREAIDRVLKHIDRAANPLDISPPLRESCGWWCIFGCNIALRHIEDPAEVERLLGIFTNKADEIAGITENWALRERVWSLENARRAHIARTQPDRDDWVIDRSDAREIAGTMSRFPTFRETGWQVLRTSKILED